MVTLYAARAISKANMPMHTGVGSDIERPLEKQSLF